MARNTIAKIDTKHKAKQKKAEENAAAESSSPMSVQSVQPSKESQDAHLAGARRSDQRRLLNLNVEQGQRHPETPAGLHSTGSFTGENEKKKK